MLPSICGTGPGNWPIPRSTSRNGLRGGARWRNELVPIARIVVAERDGAMTGFVTIDSSGYLDQLVVAPETWGSDLGNLLIAQAKIMSPSGITLLVNTDNTRAIRFYERSGFVHTHDDVNPVSGRKIYGMAWKP